MPSKPWRPNQPEQRLSIAVYRFLDRTLIRPAYFTAIHDSDGGARTDLQRIRDVNRGITTGQLDWDVVQGIEVRRGDGGVVVRALARKLELKRGHNKPTPRQNETIAALTACGAPPVIAWTLSEVHEGLAAVGFRFAANAAMVLQHLEAELDGWDREAALIRSDGVSRKIAHRRVKNSGATWRLPG